MRTITIELRVDYDEKEKDRIMIQAAREACRTLIATAALISEKRKPQIKLETGDLFSANEQVEILSDEDIDDELNAQVTTEGNNEETS